MLAPHYYEQIRIVRRLSQDSQDSQDSLWVDTATALLPIVSAEVGYYTARIPSCSVTGSGLELACSAANVVVADPTTLPQTFDTPCNWR